MKKEKAYLIGVHRYAFKAGIKGHIIAVEFVQPSNTLEFRLAYKVVFDDGVIYWVAASDIEAGNYVFLSEFDVQIGLTPKIIN